MKIWIFYSIILKCSFKIQSPYHSPEDSQVTMARGGQVAAGTTTQVSSASASDLSANRTNDIKKIPVCAAQCSTKLKLQQVM